MTQIREAPTEEEHRAFMPHGNGFGVFLCETLGVDPQMVRSVTLHVEADDVVTATIVKYVSEPQMRKVLGSDQVKWNEPQPSVQPAG